MMLSLMNNSVGDYHNLNMYIVMTMETLRAQEALLATGPHEV